MEETEVHRSRVPTSPGVPRPIAADVTPIDGSVNALTQMTQTLVGIKADLDLLKGASPSESEDRLSAVETAVTRIKPWKTLLGLVGFLVVGAIAVISTLSDYAQEAVVETVKAAHADETNPIEPSEQRVKAIEKGLKTTGDGVQLLLDEKDHQKEVKAVEVELGLHQQQHEELVQEWSAKKAARRNAGNKPQKTPEHLKLEADYKTLLED